MPRIRFRDGAYGFAITLGNCVPKNVYPIVKRDFEAKKLLVEVILFG
jgi:hypothetical protein